jgi:hypothetical protein
MTTTTSLAVNRAICEALGLDIDTQRVSSVVIELRPHSFPTVSIQRWLEAGSELEKVLERFTLAPMEDQ